VTIYFVILAIIALNALYVAAEFAAVAVRKVRIENLAEEGDSRARALLPHIKNAAALDRFVSASQIGITVTSLSLGAFGQGSLTESLSPLVMTLSGMSRDAASALSATIVLGALTTLQVVFAELVPKAVAMRYPEPLGLALVWPMSVFIRVFSWFIDVLNATGQFFLKLVGVPIHYERHIHSPEEIELLIIQGRERGSLEDEEHRRLRRVLRFAETRVRELMVPRTRIKAAPRNASRTELVEALANSPYTRLPVHGDSMDEIVGLVHVKDVAIKLASDGDDFSLSQIMRPIPHVPLGMPVDEVLELMRRERAQMAIVLDEYGGTAGLVTMEDLVEEILGEVQDEFDREVPSFVKISEREAMLRGDLSLGDLEEQMGVEIEDDEVNTVGGLIMKLLGRPPVQNDRVTHQGCAFVVEEVRGYRVQRVRMILEQPADGAS
jgi:putative hemolysin